MLTSLFVNFGMAMKPGRLTPFCAFVCLLGGLARAAVPSFDDFFREVSECRLDMTQYGRIVEAHPDGVLISLPSAGAVRGLLINAFYFAPGKAYGPQQYGLLINAPMEAVAKTFPEFVGRHTVNGHLRQLARLSDQTGDSKERRKTLLVCVAGTAV